MARLILIIDGDAHEAARWREAFARFGLRSYVVPSPACAASALASWAFDAVVLRTPTLDAPCLAALERLRACGASPVLLLADRGDEAREIAALACGALDVLPSSASSELVAAKLVRLLDARAEPPRPSTARPRTVGSLAIDERAGLASVDGLALDLTPYQFQLVSLLASKPGEVVSREEVRDILMGASDIRVVDVQVSRIRKKLKGLNADDIVLRTVRGRGYSLAARAVRARPHPLQPDSRA